MINIKEDFKRFVKANPKLINYVKEKDISWQKLYEIYALYGEDEKIWNEYIIDKNKGLDDLIILIKKFNLESIKSTIDGIQKVISIIQDLTKEEKSEEYIPNRKYENIDD